MVQNHLLQVLGTIAIEPPSFFNATDVRNESVKVFESLRPIKPSEVKKYAVQGQYVASKIHWLLYLFAILFVARYIWLK